MQANSLNIGIIGAGGFAHFAARAFSALDGVKIAATHDLNKDAAEQLASIFNARVYHSYDHLLQDDAVDLIYIATPPYLHYEQSRKALLAGKHVVCEKPAALKTSEAEALRDLAISRKLLYVVNLMQRYNPLYKTVTEIIRLNLLGSFLHGYFENYASDEYLNADHWFWDPQKSGGIFIEHGVHFFDMFSGWLGEGEVISAVSLKRPGTSPAVIDRVQATMLYQASIVNIYHGFDQPKILDRQELRLQFERGDITLYEWVPVQMKLHAIVKTQHLHDLKALLGDIDIVTIGGNETPRMARARFNSIDYDHHIIAECGSRGEKEDRYASILIAMLSDQWQWIKNREHKRVIDSNNAVESIRLAERATLLASHNHINSNF